MGRFCITVSIVAVLSGCIGAPTGPIEKKSKIKEETLDSLDRKIFSTYIFPYYLEGKKVMYDRKAELYVDSTFFTFGLVNYPCPDTFSILNESSRVITRKGEIVEFLTEKINRTPFPIDDAVKISKVKMEIDSTGIHAITILGRTFMDYPITTKESAPTGKQTAYTVKKGDTIYSIANAFNVKVEDILKINNLPSGKVLPVGATILITN